MGQASRYVRDRCSGVCGRTEAKECPRHLLLTAETPRLPARRSRHAPSASGFRHLQDPVRRAIHDSKGVLCEVSFYISLEACKQLRLVHQDFPYQLPTAAIFILNGSDNRSEQAVVLLSTPDVVSFTSLEESTLQLQDWLLRHLL